MVSVSAATQRGGTGVFAPDRVVFAGDRAGAGRIDSGDRERRVWRGAAGRHRRSPSVVGVSTTTTDSRGEYRFPALPSGVYEITAALQGFTTKKIPDVQLQLGQILKLDVPLQRRGAAHPMRRGGPIAPSHD